MLDLLLPQRCVVCSRPGAQVCAECTSALRPIVAPACERCGAPTAWPVRRCTECAGRRLAFVRARAAVEYDEPVRRVVAAWKERGLRRLAEWAAQVVVEAIQLPDGASCIAFVPGDSDRRLERGHHPAERLAHALASKWGLAVEPVLVRARGSPRQRGLGRLERRRNVAAAFACRRPVAARVLLVDDVYTTGATANAAASALRRGGARSVEVLTFARTIRIR
ncbi:MAG: double zinc ribbon domain-containing protein [Gaiellaceae bacterium]